MSLETVDIELWIERVEQLVKDEQKLRVVGGTVEISSIDRNRNIGHAVFVMPGRERAVNDSGSSLRSRQTIEVFCQIVSVVPNVRDNRGEAGHQALKSLRTSIFRAFYGWLQPGFTSGLQLAGGQLISYNQYNIFWGDLFSARYILSE